jgi:hypothetical protein
MVQEHKKTLSPCLSGLAAGMNIGNIGDEPGTGLGPFSNLYKFPFVNPAAETFSKVVSNILGIMTIGAGLWFLFKLVSGAYTYMSAGGEAQKVEAATKQITSALIGLVIITLAYAGISLIGRLLGLNILNPQEVIKNLGP